MMPGRRSRTLLSGRAVSPMAPKPSTDAASKPLSAGRLYRSETPRSLGFRLGFQLGLAPFCPLMLCLLLCLPTALALGGCVRHLYTPYSGPSEELGGSRIFAASSRSDRADLVPRQDAPLPTLRPLPAGELDYGWHDAFMASKPKPCTGVDEPSAKVMISRSPGPKRWVVILPIWGSSIYPPRQIARRLLRSSPSSRTAASDTNVLWILGPDELFDWQAMADAETEDEYLGIVTRGADCLAASIRDVREWLDWIGARSDYDPDRLGLVGFSIGAVAAASVVAMDPRPDATVLIMGGGRLEHVFAGCRGDARLGRDGALSNLGWSLDEFLRRTAEPLSSVDPVDLLGARGPAVDPETIFFSAATKDTCIPEISRESLWRALGRPERLQVPYGHKMSFLSMTFLGFHQTSHRILDFLDRTLQPEPPEVPSIHTDLSPER